MIIFPSEAPGHPPPAGRARCWGAGDLAARAPAPAGNEALEGERAELEPYLRPNGVEFWINSDKNNVGKGAVFRISDLHNIFAPLPPLPQKFRAKSLVFVFIYFIKMDPRIPTGSAPQAEIFDSEQ